MASLDQIKDPIIKKLSIINRGKTKIEKLDSAFLWSHTPEGYNFWQHVNKNPSVSFGAVKSLLPKNYKLKTAMEYTPVKSLYQKVKTGMKYKAVTTYGTKFSGIIHINESGNILLCNKNGVGITSYDIKGYSYARNVGKGTVDKLKSNGIVKIEIMYGTPETIVKPEPKVITKLEPAKTFVPVKELIDVAPGTEFTANIECTKVTGKIQKEDGRYFLCQNKKDGTDCKNKLGYNHSWVVGSGTISDLKSNDITNLKLELKVEPKPAPIVYKDRFLQVTFCKDHVVINGVKITDEQLEGIALAQGLFEIVD
jgi:hypothetical protein